MDRTQSCSRSLIFWYEDGNIILRVEDTLFRIHRGVLQTHSLVFRDTFEMPQPPGDQLLDGCPVVCMTGDSVKSWESILMFMYQPLKMSPTVENISAGTLCSLISLASKYQFDDLFKSCVQRLRTDLPVSLDGFDKAHPASVDRPRSRIGGTPLTASAASLFQIINTAVAHDIECVLPCAYYLVLSRLRSESILTGAKPAYGEGESIMLAPVAQQAILCGADDILFDLIQSNARYIHIYGNSVTAAWQPWCTEERQYQLELEIDTRREMDPDYDPIGLILPWPDCEKAFRRMNSRAIDFLSNVRGREFILARCAAGEFFGDFFSGMCDTCTKKERELRETERNIFWGRLPAVFGIGKHKVVDSDGEMSEVCKSWAELLYFNLDDS